MAIFLAPAMPWIIGGAATMAAGIGGWFTGFLGSNSVKNLMWFIAVIAVLITVVYLFGVHDGG